MKKNILGLAAIVFAVALVAFTKAPERKVSTTDIYFQFAGSHGQEADETKWNLVADFPTYDAISCDEINVQGCKLTTTKTQLGGTRPLQVLTDGDGTPTGGDGVTEIKNKQ